MSSVKTTAQAALAGLLALSVVSLAGCSKPTEVKCYGVAAKGADQWIGMPKGECAKLANSVEKPMTPAESAQVQVYPATDYVKCYGVAAANMNDCGTKTSACGGSYSMPASPDAWIAIPGQICSQVKGAILEEPGSDTQG